MIDHPSLVDRSRSALLVAPDLTTYRLTPEQIEACKLALLAVHPKLGRRRDLAELVAVLTGMLEVPNARRA